MAPDKTDRRAEVSRAGATPTNPRSSSRLVWSFSGGFVLVFVHYFYLIWGPSSDSISPLCLVPPSPSPPPGMQVSVWTEETPQLVAS